MTPDRPEGTRKPPSRDGTAPRAASSFRVAPGSRVGSIAQQWGMLLVLVVMIIVFSLLRPHTFPTTENLETILNNQVVLIFVAMAAMMALVIGGFDLSITSVLSLAGVLVIGLQGRDQVAWPMAALICLVAGLGAGWVNGMIVARLRLNSFVVTLAT